MKGLLALLLLVSAAARAETFTESFKTLENYGTASTAVWNIAENRVHLPYRADSSTATPGGVQTVGTVTQVNIGTGKDGAFDASTFTAFDSNATSSLVTLDTSRVYEFTTFTLPAGVTIRGSGTAPLRIRVQGDAEIGGTVDLNGQPGSDLSADTSLTPSAGAAGPGGGDGGDGASTNSGIDGSSADLAGLGGGKAGTLNAGTGGGGGGAGYDTAGAAGAGAGAGAAGGDYGDILLASLLGGSGGGGGGAGDNASGGGGGGGGGAFSLSVGGDLAILSTGGIECMGGDGGGTANGALKGGGGGGGSGGAVLLLVGGLLSDAGHIKATGGLGGTVTLGGNGGNGQKGRTRFVNQTPNSWIFTNPDPTAEEPTPNMGDFGEVVFDPSGPFVVESKAIDSGNSEPTYTAAAFEGAVLAPSTATLEVAGSSDGFVTDTTGFVPASDPSPLNGKRFFKFRLTLTSALELAPALPVSPDIRSVSVSFTPHEQGKFNFGFAGCARVSSSGGKAGPLGILAWLVYLLSLPSVARRRKARR